MKINTYQIFEDEKKLVYEELYDNYKNLIHYIDHISKPKNEKKYKYNDQNLMIKEIEISNNKILNTIIFDENLFEETIIKYGHEGFIKTIFQDGDEILRTENKFRFSK